MPVPVLVPEPVGVARVPRLRVGVALLVPEPAATEVDGLRRALDDGALGRIPAHLTLVPPVNVRQDRLEEALAVLRSAAASSPPLTVTLGPPATFAPTSPVLYLEVAGALDALAALREAGSRGPLARPASRPTTHPFVPHVTVADEAAPERIEAALVALAGFRRTVTFEHVHLLVEGQGRVWSPLADAALATPAVVGRGGLALELTVSQAADPPGRRISSPAHPFAITARRHGRVVGVAEGAVAGPAAHLHGLQVVPGDRGEGIGSHLLAAVESLAAEHGCEVLVGAPHDFLARHGWVDGCRRLTTGTS